MTRFLSTPSARRATCGDHEVNLSCNISIHALREEGDHFFADIDFVVFISIHALREEGDGFTQELVCEELNFYPRPP